MSVVCVNGWELVFLSSACSIGPLFVGDVLPPVGVCTTSAAGFFLLSLPLGYVIFLLYDLHEWYRRLTRDSKRTSKTAHFFFYQPVSLPFSPLTTSSFFMVEYTQQLGGEQLAAVVTLVTSLCVCVSVYTCMGVTFI
jgi:hypothetical protein